LKSLQLLKTVLKSLLCSPMLHLFDQKYSKIILHKTTKIVLWWQSWIFSIITPVFSLKWSFRNLL